MENNSKNRRLVIAIMLVAVVLITVGGTFAYFITQAGRNEEQKLTIQTGNLALTFEDNDDGLNERIMIGESKEKLFIIRNTGTETVTTNMIWDGLVNTYIEESLSYTLEYKTSEDGTQAWPNGNGTETFTTSGTNRFTHTGEKWNAKYNDAKYVGWMYGPSGTTASTSKSQAQTNTAEVDLKKNVVDPWYKTNIADKGLGKYIGDEIFCNDRSTAPSGSTWWTSDTKKGFGTNATAYGGWSRFMTTEGGSNTNPNPTFVCPEKNDAFTVSDTTKGNGNLTYPIGLITADEIVAAGSGKFGFSNYHYYLYKSSGYWYWSFSPWRVGTNGNANMFDVNGCGDLAYYTVGGIGAVAPVINIAPNYAKTLIGEGTMTSPYQIPVVE